MILRSHPVRAHKDFVLSLDTLITHNTLLPVGPEYGADACALVLMGGGGAHRLSGGRAQGGGRDARGPGA